MIKERKHANKLTRDYQKIVNFFCFFLSKQYSLKLKCASKYIGNIKTRNEKKKRGQKSHEN